MKKLAHLLERKYPQFNTASPQMPVSDALYQMCCENNDFLIVMEDGKFKGIISDHDIASRILFEERPLKEIRVAEFMNTTLPVATPDTTVSAAVLMLERFGGRHLAVYDHFAFRGVVSSADLMHEAANSSRMSAEEEEPRLGYPWIY